jgi:hypothetical protein
VIDDIYPAEFGVRIYAQNVGCDLDAQNPCPTPGAPRTIEAVDPAQVDYVGAKETWLSNTEGALLWKMNFVALQN